MSITLQRKENVFARLLHRMHVGDKSCMFSWEWIHPLSSKKTLNKKRETNIPAGYSQVETVENDQGVHAPALPAGPKAVQASNISLKSTATA